MCFHMKHCPEQKHDASYIPVRVPHVIMVLEYCSRNHGLYGLCHLLQVLRASL